MPTYIKREELETKLFDAAWYDNRDEDVAWDIVQSVARADVIPVVRCKDCEQYRAQCIDESGQPYAYVPAVKT